MLERKLDGVRAHEILFGDTKYQQKKLTDILLLSSVKSKAREKVVNWFLNNFMVIQILIEIVKTLRIVKYFLPKPYLTGIPIPWPALVCTSTSYNSFWAKVIFMVMVCCWVAFKVYPLQRPRKLLLSWFLGHRESCIFKFYAQYKILSAYIYLCYIFFSSSEC